jgi:proline iminopeptidase
MADRLPRERLIAVDGAELWVAEQGEGRPVVLCNGGLGCCDYLGPVAAMIDDLVRVYRVEPRGCGRSSRDGPYGLDTSLADLDALRRAFGHDRWLVGGHSAGADLALAYALSYPERVDALLYLSGTGIQDDRRWHEAYEAGRAGRGERLPAFAYPFNRDVNRAGNASWREFIKRPMLPRRIADLTVPTLVVYGSEDIRPSWPAHQIANLMPNARFELIDGAEHHLELTRPDDLRQRLRSFLRDVPTEERTPGW